MDPYGAYERFEGQFMSLLLPWVVAYSLWQVWKLRILWLWIFYCQLGLQTVYCIDSGKGGIQWRHSVVSHPFTSFLFHLMQSAWGNVWNGFTQTFVKMSILTNLSQIRVITFWWLSRWSEFIDSISGWQTAWFVAWTWQFESGACLFGSLNICSILWLW